MIRAFIRLRDVRLVRYLLASVGALAVDMGSFLLLLAAGLAATPAAALGYCAGIIVHWLLSSRTVFHDGVLAKGAGRGRQKLLFIGSALVGLALTTLIVAVGEHAGIDPRLAKIVAVGTSFVATYLLRKVVVFAPQTEP